MAKEFKEYDKKYAEYKGKLMPYEEDMKANGVFNERDAQNVIDWPLVQEFMPSYPLAIIRKAVYEVEGAEDWQKFRVSLKGGSTREKLYRLAKRWQDSLGQIDAAIGFGTANEIEAAKKRHEWEVIRINNYLGALVRGGQLNRDLEIIR